MSCITRLFGTMWIAGGVYALVTGASLWFTFVPGLSRLEGTSARVAGFLFILAGLGLWVLSKGEAEDES